MVWREYVDLLNNRFVVLECLWRARFGLWFPDIQRPDVKTLTFTQFRHFVDLSVHGFRNIEKVEASRGDHVCCGNVRGRRRQWCSQPLICALRSTFPVKNSASRRRVFVFSYDVQIHVPLLERLFERRWEVMSSFHDETDGFWCSKRV